MTNSDRGDSKITPFPSAEERKALEKARIVHHTVVAPDEPMVNLPPVVKILCLLNVAIFVFGKIFPTLMNDDLIYTLAFVPNRYFGDAPLGLTAIASPLTHIFIHAGWLHLAINVSTLMAFGAGLEKAIGGRRLLLLYFVTGICGAFIHAFIYPNMDAPMIGASGAISGLFGGVLMMMYNDGLMGQGYRRLLPLVLIWIGISVFFGVFGVPGTDNPIAWTTHIGGFISGLLLYKPLCRLRVRR